MASIANKIGKAKATRPSLAKRVAGRDDYAIAIGTQPMPRNEHRTGESHFDIHLAHIQFLDDSTAGYWRPLPIRGIDDAAREAVDYAAARTKGRHRNPMQHAAESTSTPIPCLRHRDAHAAIEWSRGSFGFGENAICLYPWQA